MATGTVKDGRNRWGMSEGDSEDLVRPKMRRETASNSQKRDWRGLWGARAHKCGQKRCKRLGRELTGRQAKEEGQKCEVKPAKKRKPRQEEEEEGIQAKQSPSRWAPVGLLGIDRNGSSLTQRDSELGIEKKRQMSG
ncbi:hypothetical protein BKA82DRAFT_4017375 [Pisolithus tinctorius]|nr:hypothetical protein BKA82DRAFT_4017375 [Pisolithus tinctorius]